jgi:hypothetical protein
VRLRVVLLGVILWSAAACGGSSQSAARPVVATSTVPTSTVATNAVAASSTTATTSTSGVCAPYLDFIAHGFASEAVPDLAANLPTDAPPEVVNAVRFLQEWRPDGGRVPDEVVSTLQAWVLNVCSATYLKDVHPEATTADAARKLFAAFEAGDRPAAVPVASSAALARFDPWGPSATPAADQFIVVDESTFRFDFGTNGDYINCTGSDGVIQVCDLIQQ